VLVRTLLVILKTTISAVVFNLIFLFEGHIHPLFIVFALLAITGLVSGMMARRLLKANTRLLQFLVALMALFAALFALNFYTSGVIGISYLTIYNAEIDIDGFIQTGIGFLTMWMALAAWRKPKAGRRGAAPQSPPRSFRAPEMQLEVEQQAAERVRLSPARRAINWLSAHSTHPFVIGGSRRTPASPPRAVISLAGNNGRPRRITKIRARRSTLLLGQRKPVKFVGAEEHRCPYCLETVVYNDPRGVEICSICHTHHHADCWEVTGVCQVPHANG
jgi:ribosomal protein L37AE/L43A